MSIGPIRRGSNYDHVMYTMPPSSWVIVRFVEIESNIVVMIYVNYQDFLSEEHQAFYPFL